MKGKIKFFNSAKGYGFITMEGNKDIFFHVSELLDQDDSIGLMTDNEVEFEIGKGTKGDKAVKIKKIERGEK